MVKQVDPETGQKMINHYTVLHELGRGAYGKVKLCVDMETNQQYVCYHVFIVYVSLLAVRHGSSFFLFNTRRTMLNFLLITIGN